MNPKEIAALIAKIQAFAKAHNVPCQDDLGTDEASQNRKVEGIFFGGIRSVKGRTEFYLSYRLAYEKCKTNQLFELPIVGEIINEFTAVGVSHNVSDNLHVLTFDCISC